MNKWGSQMTIAAMLLVWAGTAAAVTDAEKCEAAKNKVAGKYAFCREKAEAKAIKAGGSPDYSKCDATFSQKWLTAETNSGGMCPTNGDQAAIQSFIAGAMSQVALALSTGTTAACVGGGGGAFPATGQTTAYGPGSDGAVQAGATLSYTDNGDGTITDNVTGLMWEKKDDSGGIHDTDNAYSWSGASYGATNEMDGTITTTFLATLNSGGGFAGHTDWRIPNRRELESIVNLENYGPAVSPAFNTGCMAGCTVTTCSCTQSYDYWSSTTYQNDPFTAWFVYFPDGYVFGGNKSFNTYVRAVRGGS